jgi:hypothetical protein
VVIDWTLDLFFPRDIVYLRGIHAIQGSSATGIALDPHPDHHALTVR